jgi:signal transduction histidine kinase
MLAPIAAEKGIALSFDAPADGLIIRCDRDRVFQVLSNLIGNSLKFTPQGGSIVIVAQPAGEAQVVIAVSDTGPGISPVIRPHIFERFWQGEDDTRKGRGLGLYIAKGLVEAQGGAIWVDSPPEGGATFSFTLSLASAVEVDSFRATMEKTSRGPHGHGPTVGRG